MLQTAHEKQKPKKNAKRKIGDKQLRSSRFHEDGTRVTNAEHTKQYFGRARDTWRKGIGSKRRGIRRLSFGSAT